MSTSERSAGQPGHADRQLVDLVGAALVDPNMHTDMRMRLHRELTELLSRAHEDLHGSGGGAGADHAAVAESGHVPSLLEAVLVDPNLHTDARLRLHHEIQNILRSHGGS
jgi:hypothetical protein